MDAGHGCRRPVNPASGYVEGDLEGYTEGLNEHGK
jgi:hypothetical protein